MTSTAKVSAFLAALIAVFAVAFGAGNAVGPIGPAADRTSPAVETGVEQGGTDMEQGAGD